MLPDREELTPELQAAFDLAFARLKRRRRIHLFGYLASLVVMLVGMLLGLAWMGYAEEGEFRGWILMVPFALTGLILWGCGRWAKKV